MSYEILCHNMSHVLTIMTFLLPNWHQLFIPRLFLFSIHMAAKEKTQNMENLMSLQIVLAPGVPF